MTARSTVFLILSLFLFEVSQASTYYVKPGGADANTGASWAQAYRTMDKVQTVMLGGDTCFVGPGSYFNVLVNPPAGGTATKRTAYISGNGVDNTPSFSTATWYGGDSLTGWTVYSGNVYQVSFTSPKWNWAYGTKTLYMVAQDTVPLQMVTAIGSVTQGKYYYDETGNILYAYCYDLGKGVNPNSYGMFPGQHPIVTTDNPHASNVTFLGLRMKAAEVAVVFFGFGGGDSVYVDHCYLGFIGQLMNNNAGVVGSRDVSSGYSYGCRLRADTLDNCVAQNSFGYEGATDLYAIDGLVIESCYVGPHLGTGLWFKSNNSGARCKDHIWRYNTIKVLYSGNGGIYMTRPICNMQIYGNTVEAPNFPLQLRFLPNGGGGDVGTVGTCIIENNTFYRTANGDKAEVFGYDASTSLGNFRFRRNILYNGTAALFLKGNTYSLMASDSNLFYNMTQVGYTEAGGTYATLANWQTTGNDLHGVYKNPQFTNPAANDFSRPSVSAEFNATLPDGKQVTRYGAWQGGGSFVYVAPPNWIMADSIHSDFSGEMDSLRLRFLTSTQSWPDSVILALTTNNTLPTYGQASDRWSKRYSGATKYDTLYITKQITEPDTIIVGAWTKSIDSGYSAGVYDTIILHGVQLPTPVPINYIQLDSIRCDFSGESDSIRVRFQTQSQTGNDSVVMAISLTNALPTVTSTDRWAKAYVASKTDTSFIIRQIVESDTIIIGGWVKQGTTWSTPKYDTLILRAAVVQTPLPLNYVQIDSVRSDFSGESDSIRVRFQAQAQTGNDSVVMAISLTNALPTVTSTDRWAKAYVASKTDTSIIIRQIVESDTIIIGGWVKQGTTWSTPKYDTLILRAAVVQTPLPLNYVQIDSVHSDFSGESDSIRVRFQTQAQTGNDSVVIAISLTNAFPTVTSADRWAKVYVAASTDNSYIVRQIVETDTIIIGGWVKQGTTWSTPKYDTLILTQPPPSPLTALYIDSVHCDFSGENDSLRVRFQTSSQTFPDSVVLALTTNGTLPTVTTSGRWARAYSAGVFDTSFIVRQILEPDTVIIGGWVKDGAVWSSARYDTVILYQPPPAPALSIVIDSAIYDYSGENDSLRFRYRTGTQTWPESVVVALSLTTALPTTGSTDRWAMRYAANADLAFFGTKLINEPDTVIVGTWVKEGGGYSTGIYDTVALTPALQFLDVAPADVTSSSATIDWSTNLLATSQVEYGLDTTYGYATTRDVNKVKKHSVVVTGLLAARTYHFRVVSDPGSGPKKSADTTFLTSMSTGGQLLISGADTTAVTDSSATILWTTSSPANSQVEYGTTTLYGASTPVDTALFTNHLMFVSGLSPRTTYYWRVVSVDQLGNRAVSADSYFRTRKSIQQNIARHKPPRAASTRPGYSAAAATDTIIDPYGGTSTVWMCNPSNTQAQWLEIDLGIDSLINKVIVYWAWDSAHTTWTTPQAYSIQRWNGVSFEDILWVSNPMIEAATVTSFPDTVRTSRIRLYQPPHLGPIDQPNLLALTEVEVYGIPGIPQNPDTTSLVSDAPTISIVSQPQLAVNNFSDTGSNQYYFEIARDSSLQQVVASSGAVPQQIGTVTAWKVPEPLTPGQTYFWRANVNQLIYGAVHTIMVLPQTHAYPNPFKLADGGAATFTAVPAGSNLIILTVSGDVVKRWTNNTGVDVIWDGRNESGSLVAPGTYLWFVENTQLKGKLIVLY